MASRLSEIEAVNYCLSMLARRPVNSLAAADLVPDAAMILAELRHQNRLVQQIGWHFNTEYSVKLEKDVNDRVPLTADISRVDSAKRGGGGFVRSAWRLDLTQRAIAGAMFLFDKGASARQEDGFDFSTVSEVWVDLVRLLDFEETPDSFRHYVTIRTGRAIQGKLVTDPALYRFSLDDEGRALQVLQKEELDTSDASALNRRWMLRRSPLGRMESI